MGIPLCHKRQQAFRQMLLGGDIGNLPPLPLPDREPLLDLIHPGTMHGRKVAQNARMFRQPGLDLCALVPLDIVEHHLNQRDVRSPLALHIRQKRDEFHLPFPLGRRGIDLPGAGVKAGKQIQGAFAGILVLNTYGPARLGGQGRRFAGPWRRPGFLVHAQDPFPHPQGARIAGDNFVPLRCKGRIAWDLRRQPQMMPPRFELVGGQNALDGLGRDRRHHPVVQHMSGQLGTIPLREGPAHHIGAFTRQLAHGQRHLRGKNGLAARAFLVGEARHPLRYGVQRPLAHTSFA
jgi:hypothetical protein